MAMMRGITILLLVATVAVEAVVVENSLIAREVSGVIRAAPVDNTTMHTMTGVINATALPLPGNATLIAIPMQPHANATVNPCANFVCTNGTVCQLQTVNCLLPPCPPLPQCVAPSTGGSNSTADPCSTMRCGNGTVCKTTTVNCLLPPCPPLAQCASPSTGPSCMTMKCAANTTCVDLPTGSVCQPNGGSTVDPCATMKCGNGTFCKLQTVNCLVAPCPPHAQCATPSTGPSCMTMKCAGNTTCVDLPTGSVCQPNGGSNSTVDPCSTMRCGNGTVCKLQTVNCLVAPCPPLAQCVAPSTGPSCMTMKCMANTTCVDLPTGSVCQPNGAPTNSTTNPCASMLCAVGSVCELQTVNCLVAPCPPVAACVPRTTNSSACLTMECAVGFECRNGDKGETCYPISAPHPDACANHTCPEGQSCHVLMVNCLVAPCPPPQANCLPANPGNDSPCNAMECAAGFFCVVQHGEAECVHKSGASCAATSCPVNTTCIDYKEGAACLGARPPSSNLTCATVKCSANTTCSITPTGPTCLPSHGNDSPCNAMECAAGFFCVVQHGEAECVHKSGASCAATSCPVNTTCIEYKEGAACLDARPPSSNLTCATVKCAANTTCSITPTGPTCLPSHGNDSPCNAMECATGFFCVVQHGEAECVHKSGASCAATSCPVNTTCIDFKEGAACLGARPPSSNLTCATVKCAANTTCIITPSGPTCVQSHDNHSACNAMECAKGFFCIVQHGEAECVRHSGASCAATSCPVNTTCIEFRDGATCMDGLISGGCANITCGGRSRCKDTLEGPRCISTGRRDDRVVDINGCGRGEQYTQCMPQCEDTCRGLQTCDLSIPASSNSTVWTNSTTFGPNGNFTDLPSSCVSGCICRDHFRRNVQGNCVPNKRCWLTPGCRDNEHWTGCGSCEKTCSNPSGAGQVCAAMCRSGCACDEGYVRSKRGLCVLQEDCRAIDLINGDHGNRTIAIEG